MDEKIIKAKLVSEAAGGALAPRVVRHEVYDASQKAKSIVDAAGEEAKQIVDEARRQADEVRDAAQRDGFDEGLARWNQIVLEATAGRDRVLKDCESEMVRLAVRLAEKIVGEQLRVDPTSIVAIVAEALKSVRHERSLSIQVNPLHVEAIRERLDRLRAASLAARDIQIVPNPAVAPGGCVVETELGTIDAQLATQLKCLELALERTARE